MSQKSTAWSISELEILKNTVPVNLLLYAVTGSVQIGWNGVGAFVLDGKLGWSVRKISLCGFRMSKDLPKDLLKAVCLSFRLSSNYEMLADASK